MRCVNISRTSLVPGKAFVSGVVLHSSEFARTAFSFGPTAGDCKYIRDSGTPFQQHGGPMSGPTARPYLSSTTDVSTDLYHGRPEVFDSTP